LTAITPMLRSAVGASIDVRLSLASGVFPVRCDARQLESVILNFAVNARDAMPSGGILAIKTANILLVGHSESLLPGWYASICVADTGAGMTAETRERAFDAYFTTKPRGVGTGLGLSIARSFARKLGGDIEIASAPGEGTAMTLYLPCAEVAMI
jgi:signal transduction histidine kinase